MEGADNVYGEAPGSYWVFSLRWFPILFCSGATLPSHEDTH